MILLPRKELQDTLIFSFAKDHELFLQFFFVTEAVYVYEGNMENRDKHPKKEEKIHTCTNKSIVNILV